MSATPHTAPPDSVVQSLQSILSAIYAGADKGETVGRLYALADRLRHTSEERAILAQIKACRGWAGIVADLLRGQGKGGYVADITPDPIPTPEEAAEARRRAEQLEAEERRREDERKAAEAERRKAREAERAILAARVAALHTCLLRDDGQVVSPPRLNTSDLNNEELAAEVYYALVNAPADKRLYRTETGSICQIVTRDGRPTILTLTTDRLITMLRTSGLLYFDRNIKDKDSPSGFTTVPRLDPPEWLLRSMLDGNPPQGVPLLRGLKHSPYLYSPPLEGVSGRRFNFSAGEVITAPGYHRGSGFYLTRDFAKKGALPNLCPGATGTQSDRQKAHVAAAIAEIRKWLVDFLPWTPRDSDFCNMVGAFLLPFVRSAIDDAVPSYIVNATRQGSGKTKLARWLLHPGMGYSVAEDTLPQTEEERKKQVLSDLVESRGAILYDNVSQHMSSDTLETLITGKEFKGRRLQVNENIVVKHRLVLMFTGNNATCSTDMARRLLVIRLAPTIENPGARDRKDFQNPDTYTEQNLDRLISAAVTLIRAWLAGPNKEAKMFEGFDEFSAIVGNIIVNAGIPGWLENAKELQSTNHRDQDETVFVAEWAKRYGSEWVVDVDLLSLMRDIGVFSKIDAPRADPRATLYQILGDMRDRVYAGGWTVSDRSRRNAPSRYGYRLTRAGYTWGAKSDPRGADQSAAAE